MWPSTAITGAELTPGNSTYPEFMPTVRRLEAAGLRAWPATSVQYDGAWVVRLTAGYPSNRLNSVNTLDPGDVRDIERRIARAERQFAAYGRRLTFRVTPLTGALLWERFDAEGWDRFDESRVMTVDLDNLDFDNVMDQIPGKDVARYTAASMATQGLDQSNRAGLSEVIGAIHGEVGMFVAEQAGLAISNALCVHEGDLAGLFNLATANARRNEGHARRLLMAALKWARQRGARHAWLQVTAENAPAGRLYESIGFQEVYRYHFRRQPAHD